MKRKLWAAAGVGVTALMLACGSVPESPVEQPFQPDPAGAAVTASASARPMQTAKQVPTIENGTWEVGVDIAAGKYKVRDAVTSMCSWKITKAGTTDIVDIEIVTGGKPTVTLKKGQEFDSNCGTWVKVG